MEELKTCLFCGKSVDRTFQFCPHCGYEFGQGDELPLFAEDGGKIAEGTGKIAEGATPRESQKQSSRETEDYLGRIRTLEELLSDMERELDGILKISSKDP